MPPKGGGGGGGGGGAPPPPPRENCLLSFKGKAAHEPKAHTAAAYFLFP